MGKRGRTRQRTAAAAPLAEAGSAAAVGPRQPCPCGSGRRYKACHGAADGGAGVFVARPFAGLASECDLVALRELVPAATATLSLRGDHAGRDVTLCTLLPGYVPAMVRESGEVRLALQVVHLYGDPSRDLAAVLLRALDADPGVVSLPGPPGLGPRLQDLLTDVPLEVTVHDGFGFWVADEEETPALAAALDQANSAAAPTARLAGVVAAYWTRMGAKEHLRWVMPEPEGDLLDALARLHAAGRDRLVPDSKLVGMFRAHGLLAPVWDLEVGTGAAALEEPAAAFAEALAEALRDATPLSGEQRTARQGLANRQVTIR